MPDRPFIPPAHGATAVPLSTAGRLHLRPGDVVVLRVGELGEEHPRLTDCEYDEATARIRATLGEGVPFVLLDAGMRLDRVHTCDSSETDDAGTPWGRA